MNKFTIMSIFQKCEHDKIANVLQKSHVYGTIPSISTKQKQKAKQQTHTEWRWRFFNINGKSYVEISKKEPNKNRVYINAEGEWSDCCIDIAFKACITETHYCYLEPRFSEDEKNCQ